jgi:hypothetical protein
MRGSEIFPSSVLAKSEDPKMSSLSTVLSIRYTMCDCCTPKVCQWERGRERERESYTRRRDQQKEGASAAWRNRERGKQASTRSFCCFSAMALLLAVSPSCLCFPTLGK